MMGSHWVVSNQDPINKLPILPTGFQTIASDPFVRKTSSDANIKLKKAWEAAVSPGKELFMTGFMLWMSGTGLNIFTMMITGMAVWRPISNIISAYSKFSVYRDPSTSITAPLALYVLLCLFGLLLGLWKVKSLGLLGVEDVELPELAIWANQAGITPTKWQHNLDLAAHVCRNQPSHEHWRVVCRELAQMNN